MNASISIASRGHQADFSGLFGTEFEAFGGQERHKTTPAALQEAPQGVGMAVLCPLSGAFWPLPLIRQPRAAINSGDLQESGFANAVPSNKNSEVTNSDFG